VPETKLLETIAERIATADVKYVTTIGTDGYPRTRAMLNLRNREQYPDEADRTRQRACEAVSEEMRAIMFAQQSGLPTRTRFLATCRLGVLPRMLSGIRRFRLP